jgi:glutaredoxin
MDILVYTTSGCTYCSQVKQLFQRANLEYKEVLVNTPELKTEMVSKYPQAKTYPHVIIDGESVGGLVDTAKLFLEKGLVKSTKRK